MVPRGGPGSAGSPLWSPYSSRWSSISVPFAVEAPTSSPAIRPELAGLADTQQPPRGAVVGYAQCGAQIAPRTSSVALATRPPLVEPYFVATPGETPKPPANFPFTVST